MATVPVLAPPGGNHMWLPKASPHSYIPSAAAVHMPTVPWAKGWWCLRSRTSTSVEYRGTLQWLFLSPLNEILAVLNNVKINGF